MLLPDVILVKKTFPKLRRRQKRRFWKLKHFEDAERLDEGGLDDPYAKDDEEIADEEKVVNKQKKLSKK